MKKAKIDARLSETEIRLILRAADSITGQGGRTLLSKIPKGSKEKKLLELKLKSETSHS
jgi:hypothetical protein